MKRNTLKLGDFDLSNYVAEPIQEYKDRVKGITRLIEDLGGPYGKNTLMHERESLDNLRTQKAELTYKELNPEFLQITSTYGNKRYVVPLFTAYEVFGSNEFTFSVERYLDIFPFKTKLSIYIYNRNLQKPVGDNILKGLVNSCTSSEEMNGYCKKDKHITFTAKFNGIIPTKTKEKINEALYTFKKQELYFVVETKPEEWNRVLFKRDPLVTGTLNNRLFLIDSFDTTIAEKYVENSFSR